MNTITETYEEALARLTSKNVTRSNTFKGFFNPKSTADMDAIAKRREELRIENKNREGYAVRLFVMWRLPKGSKLSEFKGYQGTNMPHFKQEDAVIGLVYERKVYNYN